MRAMMILSAGILSLSAQPAAAASRTFVLSSFDSIEVEGDAVVEVHSGSAPTARAEGAQRDLDRVRLERGGSRLVVRMSTRSSGADTRSVAPVRIILGTRQLSDAAVRGAGLLSIDRLETQTSRLTVAGAGSLRIGILRADRVNIAINGSGRLAIGGGRAGLVSVQQLGPGMLDAPALAATSLTLNQQGTATTRLSVNGPATLTAGGAGLIELGGRPNCIRRSLGSAQVRCGGLPSSASDEQAARQVETAVDRLDALAEGASAGPKPVHRKPPK